MGKKQLSPYGCPDCAHGWVDRCGLTGHKMRWMINAKHHCEHFKRSERREDSGRGRRATVEGEPRQEGA